MRERRIALLGFAASAAGLLAILLTSDPGAGSGDGPDRWLVGGSLVLAGLFALRLAFRDR